MKIDIHVHTKKTKSGDSESRNIDANTFYETIKATDVKILAITNHNHFDIDQYTEFKEKVKDFCDIWPGVELDVLENGRRGHLLVIINPRNATSLSIKMKELLKGTNADNINISIDHVVKEFDMLDAIYIPHYFIKKPDLNDDDINKLTELVRNKNRVIKEATNSISGGIYISHGHNSIYGSDIQNWNDYCDIAMDLPELRLNVESFEQFCLLLDKDEPTINTILHKKLHDEIEIYPFGKEEAIKFNIYNDINVIFGSKGTGKTEILKSIEKYYNGNGMNTHVYQSSIENLAECFDLKGKGLKLTLDDIGVESCNDEIDLIKTVNEESVTNISNYTNFYTSTITNARAKSIKISDFTPSDINDIEREFDKINDVHLSISEFINLVSNNNLKTIIGDELFNELMDVLHKISIKTSNENEKQFINLLSNQLYNNLITIFLREISKKTGKPTKPISTGFQTYARNRIKIERAINKIITNMKKDINNIKIDVGDLGIKGKLECLTEIIYQDGNISDSKYTALRNNKKTPQKEFVKKLFIVYESIYKQDLFAKLDDLISIEGVEDIKDLDNLLLFYKYFAINGTLYKPSNGESSMVLLHKELIQDKDIFILDEPEKSLGNDYISEVIVPLLKEKAKMGKKILIATHDANIAVRTLPYNSIYRKHENDKFITYTGNPFSNNLININNTSDLIDWKTTSMRTLEGGKDAFGERGKIYGNING